MDARQLTRALIFAGDAALERAAIYEFLGMLPREDASRRALAEFG